MHRYIEFNAVKFLKESRGWESEKKRLRAEMEDLTQLKGTGDSTVRSSGTGDSTGTVVIERSRIQAQIDRINLYQEALNYAWDNLSEAFRDVLTAFFFTGGYMSRNVREYGSKYGMCIKLVYSQRRKALDELSRIITRRYGL